MTEEEFNLSKKISKIPIKNIVGIEQNHIFIYLEDVKEFIRLLKEEIRARYIPVSGIMEELDKLAGEKLVK